MTMKDFILYAEIGKGSKSTVFKARQTGSLEYLAIASIKAPHGALGRAKYENTQALDHPNVMNVYRWSAGKSDTWVVME